MDLDAISRGDAARWVAILPLGAHEQHGPHLPFETDTIIAQTLANAAAKAVRPCIGVTVLPVESTGYSPEHLDYPGTRSASYSSAIERWISIGERLSGFGFRKLLLLNAHGGNSPLTSIVATELRVRHGMLCVATNWTRFGYPDGVIDEEERKFGIHAGDIETSLMLTIRPDLVRLGELANFPSLQADLSEDYVYLRAYGPHAFGWKMQDLNVRGATGNASLATAEKGEKLLAHAVRGIADLLREMDRFDMSLLEKMPIPVDRANDGR
ncbi:MAG: creatininase family protein [Rhizobiaceae bacterium]